MNKHWEYLKQPVVEFCEAVRDSTPKKWERSKDGGKAIAWLVASPVIIPVGFILAVVLGYLSGVLNGEGVIDHRKRLFKEEGLKWVERMEDGGNNDAD